MSIDFANVVEEVKKMSYKDKQELKCLLDKYLVEEKRNEIANNYLNTLDEVKEEKISYKNNISDLKRDLER